MVVRIWVLRHLQLLWFCAPGLKFHYCQCHCVWCVSYTWLLDLRAEKSCVLRHVRGRRGEASRKPRSFSRVRTPAICALALIRAIRAPYSRVIRSQASFLLLMSLFLDSNVFIFGSTKLNKQQILLLRAGYLTRRQGIDRDIDTILATLLRKLW